MAHAISTYCSGAHGLLVASFSLAVAITIDMSGIDSVTLSANKTSASVHSLELIRFVKSTSLGIRHSNWPC